MKMASLRRVLMMALPGLVFVALLLFVDYVLFRNGDPLARGLAELSLPFIVIIPVVILRNRSKSAN